jgi:hypothetical protein
MGQLGGYEEDVRRGGGEFDYLPPRFILPVYLAKVGGGATLSGLGGPAGSLEGPPCQIG